MYPQNKTKSPSSDKSRCAPQMTTTVPPKITTPSDWAPERLGIRMAAAGIVKSNPKPMTTKAVHVLCRFDGDSLNSLPLSLSSSSDLLRQRKWSASCLPR
ncbi:uncharacterized protein B0I36DRAFT_106017 [Microdochium trichocladiopsis]|uniref:Uncharacterized protein n=1 Tax=Microdochium trichocladiopsis TaxID=1682393 RepID=A0A9P8Y8S4_9PEZI|nr:uncharacterized protein B0I36DRAFT_106017 [Microdochium trichocladiopsis]KAH7033197.1 hypothetical protein B0I36DRAFT_106017 [Microdochium trichocladiopsis]